MPVDEYREFFGKPKWNKNNDKRSKDDYLKILVKTQLLLIIQYLLKLISRL